MFYNVLLFLGWIGFWYVGLLRGKLEDWRIISRFKLYERLGLGIKFGERWVDEKGWWFFKCVYDCNRFF